jgi:hypothetical protein
MIKKRVGIFLLIYIPQTTYLDREGEIEAYDIVVADSRFKRKAVLAYGLNSLVQQNLLQEGI